MTRAQQHIAWIRERLRSAPAPVLEAHIFGSDLEAQTTPNDVDILVHYEAHDTMTIRAFAAWLGSTKRDFQSTFGLSLHVTSMTSAERHALPSFLRWIGLHLPIITPRPNED